MMNCLLLADELEYLWDENIRHDDDQNSYFPKIMVCFSVDAKQQEKTLDKWIYVEKYSSFPSVLHQDLSNISELVTYFD